jgi:phosphoglycolate phosphatase
MVSYFPGILVKTPLEKSGSGTIQHSIGDCAMRYDLVIFDFDGTLADSYPWFLSIFEELAHRYHLPDISHEDLEDLRKLDVHQILKEYKIPIWKMILIGNHLKKLMNSQIERVNMVDGMRSVVQELSGQGVKLAIVTSNAERNVRRVLGTETMAYFDAIASEVSMFGKKGKFQAIQKSSGVPASRTLSIGDEIRDLKSSRAAKIPFGAVNWGYTDVSLLLTHAPEEVFYHPGQILETVTQTD